MTALPPGYERRYVSERARTAHIVDTPGNPNAGIHSHARCCKYPAMDGWRGTGSQTERARAAALPLCRSCDRLTP